MTPSPFAALERYTDPTVHAILNPVSTVRLWLTLLDQLAKVREQTGVPTMFLAPIPDQQPAVEQMVLALLVDWRTREQQTGHDVAAFLDVVRQRWGDHLGAGLTSSNLVDFGLCAQLIAVSKHAGQIADLIGEALTTWSGDPILARTHGQPARVTTTARIATVLRVRLQTAITALHTASTALQVVNLGGPIGDHSIAGLEFGVAERVASRLRSGTGQDWNAARFEDQALSRGRIRDWAQAMAGLTTECAQIATQIRLRARDGEWAEPTGVPAETYKGSSSMPYKRNPTRAERVCGLQRVVQGLAAVTAQDVVWWDQRDISASSVERVVLPQIAHYTGFLLRETLELVTGLQTNPPVIAANLARFEALSHAADAYAQRLLQSGDIPLDSEASGSVV